VAYYMYIELQLACIWISFAIHWRAFSVNLTLTFLCLLMWRICCRRQWKQLIPTDIMSVYCRLMYLNTCNLPAIDIISVQVGIQSSLTDIPIDTLSNAGVGNYFYSRAGCGSFNWQSARDAGEINIDKNC